MWFRELYSQPHKQQLTIPLLICKLRITEMNVHNITIDYRPVILEIGNHIAAAHTIYFWSFGFPKLKVTYTTHLTVVFS